MHHGVHPWFMPVHGFYNSVLQIKSYRKGGVDCGSHREPQAMTDERVRAVESPCAF
jgi:hypothetical protein